jgi:CheY-like chemotaxis protein
VARILVIHWNAAEAAERAERLRRKGFETSCFTDPRDGAGLRALREKPPDAVVVDLSRLPSTGQAVGIALRQQKATRGVPLVFVEGDPERTACVRGLLPDAVFAVWPGIGAALRRALHHPPQDPAVPGTFAGYTGTPLPKKLRIREGSVVALVHAPEGFEAKLAPLPEGACVQKQVGNADVMLAFVKSAAALNRELPALARETQAGRTLWLIWPKKTSPLAGDLSEPKVREMGLAMGLVDYKVCAVDETWSGLAFAARRAVTNKETVPRDPRARGTVRDATLAPGS